MCSLKTLQEPLADQSVGRGWVRREGGRRGTDRAEESLSSLQPSIDLYMYISKYMNKSQPKYKLQKQLITQIYLSKKELCT